MPEMPESHDHPDPASPPAAPPAAAAVATLDEPAAPAPPPAPAGVPAPAEPTPAVTAALLAERFPALFGPGAVKPIKLRIQADIQLRAPGVFTKKQLSVFLHRHTTSTAYLRALVASPQRFDLDGAPAGDVAAEHREAAAAEVERRRQIVDQRRAAEREARRSAPRPPRPAAAPGIARATGDADPAAPPTPEARAPRPQPSVRPPRRPERDDRPPRRHPPPPRPRSNDRPVAASAARPASASDGPSREAPERLPDDPASRERALLLRAWESSPLTPANFCALKGLKVADFEAQIELARRERAERSAAQRRAPAAG